MSDALFTNVIAADLAVDIFFWISSFLACYYFLTRMHSNNGVSDNPLWIITKRYFRLTPLYLFTMLFFWKLLPIFGGEGPLFW